MATGNTKKSTIIDADLDRTFDNDLVGGADQLVLGLPELGQSGLDRDEQPRGQDPDLERRVVNYKALLDATSKQDDSDDDGGWRVQLERSLLDAELPLSCLIGEAKLRVKDLMRLAPGDVLDIDMHETHQVRVAGVSAFLATLGDARGKFALEFEEFNGR